jgi:hypothetical protein
MTRTTGKRISRRKLPIDERNRSILGLRKEGLPRRDVARKFRLSRGRISQIENQNAAEESLAERRAGLRRAIQNADDPEKPWPIEDLVDAIGLTGVTKKRLLDHFRRTPGAGQITLRTLMDMCVDRRVAGLDFMMPSLLRIYGIGKKGFWAVVDGLTAMDLGAKCNGEWQIRLNELRKKQGARNR